MQIVIICNTCLGLLAGTNETRGFGAGGPSADAVPQRFSSSAVTDTVTLSPAALIKSAMNTMKDSFERGLTTGLSTNKEELKKQTWFQGFEDQLDDSLKQTEELYQRKG